MAMASVPRRVRVVLADDTTEIRMLVRLGLELDGRFDIVAEAGDGEAAVRACGEHQPDAAVIDLAMPVMDGLEAIPLVRRASPGTRIVVLSAFSSNHMAAEARRAGADAYVEKGAASEQLVKILADLTGRPGPDAPRTTPRPLVAVQAAETRLAAEKLDDILEVVRHELRTPLALAAGFADLLGRAIDAGDASTAYERLEDVQRNIGLAQRLLTTLADAGREETGEQARPGTLVDAGHLARTLAPDFGAIAPDHKVVIGAPQRVIVRGDEDRLTQILDNLVSNAAKFSPKGTAIEITVVSVRQHAEIAVRDHGPGVPAEDEARIFSRFGRLARDRGTSGMGLGLYLSRRIAHELGGELDLQRPEDGGGGSRFVLRLPLAYP
jgi:signal transduction histidine kinase